MCGSPAWQALGTQACRLNIVQGCAGLQVMAQQNRDRTFLSPAWQALGEWPSRAEIFQGCAGLEGIACKAELMQSWGAWTSEMELLQGCAGVGWVWPGRDL
jgi:hypothetical protein